ncbi:hypothetical protein IP70_19870 [alpha proteobacterium AAP38]|nr:hypothetical protein IP70_19870 [alpha proteobacterium AAP38]
MSDLSNIKSTLVLQAGTDPAKVEAVRVQLVAAAKLHKRMAWGIVVVGVVLTATLIGGVVGIPTMVMGLFMVWRSGKLARNIDIAAQEYLASLNAGE